MPPDAAPAASVMRSGAAGRSTGAVQLVANGVLPYTDRKLARIAVNSDRIEDNLVWRYKREKCEEIGDFTEALIDYAAQFAPNIRESAAAAGVVPGVTPQRKKSIFSFGKN